MFLDLSLFPCLILWQIFVSFIIWRRIRTCVFLSQRTWPQHRLWDESRHRHVRHWSQDCLAGHLTVRHGGLSVRGRCEQFPRILNVCKQSVHMNQRNGSDFIFFSAEKFFLRKRPWFPAGKQPWFPAGKRPWFPAGNGHGSPAGTEKTF